VKQHSSESATQSIEAVDGLLAAEIQGLYSVEDQLTRMLPKMAASANDALLESAFVAHLDETRQQVSRLEKAAEMLKIPPNGEPCKAMEAVIQEETEMIGKLGVARLHDIQLLAAAGRVEHYEIACYSTALLLARKVGQETIAEMLQQSLWEATGAECSYRELTERLLSDSPLAPKVQANA
jgi:ferritin-like metal-binding protein YciE